MVQKEVKKKAYTYALMGILLASMCVALIYSVGTTPGTNPLPSPSVSPTQSPNQQTGQVSPMKTFNSLAELQSFLATSTQQPSYYYMPSGGDALRQEGAPAPVPSASPTTGHSMTTETKDHSTTNIQVEGVDEADTKKRLDALVASNRPFRTLTPTTPWWV